MRPSRKRPERLMAADVNARQRPSRSAAKIISAGNRAESPVQTFRSTLMPPIHADCGLVPVEPAVPVETLPLVTICFANYLSLRFQFAGSDQGRITSVFKAIKCARGGSVPFTRAKRERLRGCETVTEGNGNRSGLAGFPMGTWRSRCSIVLNALEWEWHDGAPVRLPGSSSDRA